ncbi:MAG: family 43 glycosylhydrolase [Chloroflexi bacterium]|nr:family 43 glycosylhydrolase [Chloroflexota bacterium]
MGVILRLVIFAAVIVGIAAYVVAYGAQPAYENPVLANDAPDPAVFRTDDGHDALGGRDLSALLLGRTTRQREMAIGVATADSPTGPFTDSGGPIITGHGFSAIDPFVLEYGGTNYVYWGSAGEPISAQELTADGTGLRGSPIEVLPRSSGEYESLIEGVWVTEHDDRFYLMYSGDACCGPEAHYAVMVARSDSPLGPYSRNPDSPILEANEEFNAPGHHATIAGPDGSDWILYHALVRPETSFRSLFLDRIDWVDGWPVINGGNGPSDCSTDAPHDPPIPRLPMCGG